MSKNKKIKEDEKKIEEEVDSRFVSVYDKDLMELVNKMIEDSDDDFTLDY